MDGEAPSLPRPPSFPSRSLAARTHPGGSKGAWKAGGAQDRHAVRCERVDGAADIQRALAGLGTGPCTRCKVEKEGNRHVEYVACRCVSGGEVEMIVLSSEPIPPSGHMEEVTCR
jgi:hypothetical protein